MNDLPINTKRDRAIRFENLVDEDRPNLLSWYEKDKNLIHIDRLQSDRLPSYMIDKLMFTTEEYTMVSQNRKEFEPYVAPYNHRNKFL